VDSFFEKHVQFLNSDKIAYNAGEKECGVPVRVARAYFNRACASDVTDTPREGTKVTPRIVSTEATGSEVSSTVDIVSMVVYNVTGGASARVHHAN
jgi:hypothetical protein